MRSRGLDQPASTNIAKDDFVSGPLQMACIKPRVWTLVHQPPLCLSSYPLRWLLPSPTALSPVWIGLVPPNPTSCL